MCWAVQVVQTVQVVQWLLETAIVQYSVWPETAIGQYSGWPETTFTLFNTDSNFLLKTWFERFLGVVALCRNQHLGGTSIRFCIRNDVFASNLAHWWTGSQVANGFMICFLKRWKEDTWSRYLVLRFLWFSVGYYDFSRNFWLVSMVCHGSTRPNFIKARRF